MAGVKGMELVAEERIHRHSRSINLLLVLPRRHISLTTPLHHHRLSRTSHHRLITILIGLRLIIPHRRTISRTIRIISHTIRTTRIVQHRPRYTSTEITNRRQATCTRNATAKATA